MIVTLIFDRSRLDTALYFTGERIKKEYPEKFRHGTFYGGRFIKETEVCYASTISTSAIKKVLLLCDRCWRWLHIVDWNYKRADEILRRIMRCDQRVRRFVPAREQRAF